MPEGGVGDQGDEGALQFAEVGLDPGSQEGKDLFVDGDALAEGAGLEHLEAGFVVRLQEFHGQSPLEA